MTTSFPFGNGFIIQRDLSRYSLIVAKHTPSRAESRAYHGPSVRAREGWPAKPGSESEVSPRIHAGTFIWSSVTTGIDSSRSNHRDMGSMVHALISASRPRRSETRVRLHFRPNSVSILENGTSDALGNREGSFMPNRSRKSNGERLLEALIWSFAGSYLRSLWSGLILVLLLSVLVP